MANFKVKLFILICSLGLILPSQEMSVLLRKDVAYIISLVPPMHRHFLIHAC